MVQAIHSPRKALGTLALALVAFATPLLLSAQAPAATPPPLLLGTAWYPEQWPEAVWEQDLQRM